MSLLSPGNLVIVIIFLLSGIQRPGLRSSKNSSNDYPHMPTDLSVTMFLDNRAVSLLCIVFKVI